jgi:hypothetical protein
MDHRTMYLEVYDTNCAGSWTRISIRRPWTTGSHTWRFMARLCWILDSGIHSIPEDHRTTYLEVYDADCA